MSDVFEFRGVDNLYIARVLKDNATEYTCETPVKLSAVAEIGKTTDSSNEAHYYDNKAMIVVSSESADVITLTVAPPELDMLSKIIGRSYDETTGMMVESPRTNDYYAIMYRTKGTDGEYRYVTRLKGQFNIPEETNATENDGTDTNNSQIEFTGIYTEHEFTKGKYVNGSWEAASAKGIVVDTRFGLANVSNFFTAVQTPDTVSTSPSIGQLDIVVAAGASGKTQVDTVNPVTANGDKLMYKLGDSAQTVAYDDVLTTGWTALSLDTDITATAGQVITVAEITKSDSKARKVGHADVVVGA